MQFAYFGPVPFAADLESLCRRLSKPLPPTCKAFAADRAHAQIMHALVPGVSKAPGTKPRLARGGICEAY